MSVVPGKQFFTEQADPALAVKVRQIGGRHDRFTTDVLGDAGNDDNRTYTWLEAWRDTGNNLWYLDQYTRMPDVMGDAVHKKSISTLGICFFDALHHCSIFQQMEEEKGRVISAATEGNPALVNYREAAKEAGQVIDRDGIAQPCADGRILTDGFFRKEDLAIAMNSRTVTPLTRPAIYAKRDLAELVFRNMQTDQAGADIAPALLFGTQKRDIINAFKRAAETGTTLLYDFGNARDNDYKHFYNRPGSARVGAVFSTVISAGLYPLIGSAVRPEEFRPETHFKNNLKSFQVACAALPDCPEKTLLVDFATATHSTFYLDRANSHYQACVRNKSPGSKIMDGLADIERGARIASKSDNDIEALKGKYVRGEIENGIFWNSLKNMWDPYFRPFKSADIWNDMYPAALELFKDYSAYWKSRRATLTDASENERIEHYTSFHHTKHRYFTEVVMKRLLQNQNNVDLSGPMIRLRIHEKIQTLEANLG